jgi:hypothetical protein
MDAIEFLMKDHDTVKALLAAANTYDEMKAAFAETCPIFQSHTYMSRNGSFTLGSRTMSS